MKKLLLLISTLAIGLSNANAQTSIEITNGSFGGYIVNNDVITDDVTAGNQSHIYISIKNVSSSTKTYGLRRTDIILNPGADAYFCFAGTCYVPAVTTSPNNVTLNAGQQDQATQIYYDENVTQDYSQIQYEVYDVNNPSDVVTFTFKYNPSFGTVSVKSYASLFSSVSDVFPNPSAGKAQIVVNSVSSNNATVSITNALGSAVSAKNIELSAGKNTVSLDSENLTSGIYFVTISSNNNKIVKKFTVNK
jgi:hypothetical protein